LLGTLANLRRNRLDSCPVTSIASAAESGHDATQKQDDHLTSSTEVYSSQSQNHLFSAHARGDARVIESSTLAGHSPTSTFDAMDNDWGSQESHSTRPSEAITQLHLDDPKTPGLLSENLIDPPSPPLVLQVSETPSTLKMTRPNPNESVSKFALPLSQSRSERYSPSDGGPSLLGTDSFHQLYLYGRMETLVTLKIHAKINGFFRCPRSDKWACHRNTDFRVSLAYSLSSPDLGLSDKALLAAGISIDWRGRQESVSGFKMTVRARLYNFEDKNIDLKYTPIKGMGLKTLGLNLVSPGGYVNNLAQHGANTDVDETSGNSDPQRIVTFERIRFSHSEDKCKETEMFILVVDVYAVVGGPNGDEDVFVAVAKFNPVVVQEQCASSYIDMVDQESGVPRLPRVHYTQISATSDISDTDHDGVDGPEGGEGIPGDMHESRE
jgi:hypothetical protein